MKTARDDPVKLAIARSYSKSGRGRQIRETAGLTIGEMSRWVGSSAPTVSSWERAEHDPTGAAAIKWAQTLNRLEAPRRRRLVSRVGQLRRRLERRKAGRKRPEQLVRPAAGTDMERREGNSPA